jgi:hypothetical protein
MLFSRALIPTMKEAPADATNASHVLLSRAGYIRRVGAGIYDFLPLGLRVLRKVEKVVREEMDRAGALEVLMPALLPADYFKETGRWELYGDVLFRLHDRKNGDYHLGPTHEEIVTDIARRELRSWRDLPKVLYQVQVKFRDEPRPRGGLAALPRVLDEGRLLLRRERRGRARELRANAAGLRPNLRPDGAHLPDGAGRRRRHRRLDERGVPGSRRLGRGRDRRVRQMRLRRERRGRRRRPGVDADAGAPTTDEAIARMHTPGHGGIEDVAKLLGASKATMLKSLLYVAGGKAR